MITSYRLTPKFLLLLVFLYGCSSPTSDLQRKPGYVLQRLADGYLLTSKQGNKLKIRAYGEHMLRLQRVSADQAFYPDNHYEMVQTHDWSVQLEVNESSEKVVFSTDKVAAQVDINSLAVSFIDKSNQPLLTEIAALTKSDNKLKAAFKYDEAEHFSGLGHGYYGRADSLDLKGQVVERNYGREQIEQAPLIVPFYLSSKGYGVFVNSTFSNRFNFGYQREYSIELDDSGFGAQMDYFFIYGPALTEVLGNYTQLTGRPRLPSKAMFGLQLSDKGHDHNSPTPSDENWWKQKVAAHRQADYALDHIVNDNRWRAAGGKRCQSKLAWDPERYPEPADYADWLKQNGLVMTLDFNRCIAKYSEGWQPQFNLPKTGKIDFSDSAPDLTHQGFRDWFWQVFYQQGLNRELGYPGDALWIDEFDEQGAAPKEMLLANGHSSAEMRNYWFFLIAKALVQEGWDKAAMQQRPFVWVRGMTAGAQRYATLWSGDIYPDYKDMAGQIRSMQLAGLSGFPYWGHDAGGFYDWQNDVGPDEAMYQQWAMAFGSFAPIWKPHGMGQSRWPLDRNAKSQAIAHTYIQLRYKLMPYLYSAAHQASNSGIPIARPMMLDYAHLDAAWAFDLQYMWGDSLLIAPVTADSGNKEVWLPAGNWYNYHTQQLIGGDKVITLQTATGALPIFVKQGAVIPQREYALSTAFIDKSHLNIDIYTGADGQFTLLEDDDSSEAYRHQSAVMRTLLSYDSAQQEFTIFPAEGNYAGAPAARSYQIRLVGLAPSEQFLLNGEPIAVSWQNQQVIIDIDSSAIEQKLLLSWRK